MIYRVYGPILGDEMYYGQFTQILEVIALYSR